MKLFTWVVMGIYIALFILMGIGLAAFSLHGIPLEGTVLWLQMAYNEQRLRLAIFLTGAGLIVLNWVIIQLSIAKLQRQKTIAFENPDGQVTISLTAIEDFIRRSTRELPEVKELRSDVIAGKGRILVRARVTLWSEAHIPEVTERVQSLIRSRVQEMLSGIEEPVHVRVHVAKIAHREEEAQAKHSPGRREEKFSSPFHGF
ncbi:MAG: alkaline shock response membrane anchor protein AmaP [Candidatus Omnitrophica bacterium]|nr:alkaline shock response membrane anchor protein AmaP [Candidatus Omnitrophota bacterium]